MTRKVQSFFFSIAVKNLKVDQFKETDILAEKISHLTLKAMVKYRNHANIIDLMEIRSLITHYVPDRTDIPVTVLNENVEYIEFFNEYITCGSFKIF